MVSAANSFQPTTVPPSIRLSRAAHHLLPYRRHRKPTHAKFHSPSKPSSPHPAHNLSQFPPHQAASPEPTTALYACLHPLAFSYSRPPSVLFPVSPHQAIVSPAAHIAKDSPLARPSHQTLPC